MFAPFPGSRAKPQSFVSLYLRRLAKSLLPPPDGAELFASRLAGRYMAAQVGPYNVPYEFQPYFGGNKIGLTSASGGGTGVTTFGVAAQSAAGTATSRSIASTSLLASTRRLGYVLASAASNLATGWTVVGSANQYWRGNAAGLGGFFFHARFGFNLLATGNRHIAGMTAAVSTTADPSSALNACFIGKDAADTNWQVMFNDGSGTCTKVDTGIAPASDKLYDVFVFAPPNGSSIRFGLISYNNSGVIDASFEYETSTDLPVNTTFLSARACSGSGSGTTGGAIDILQVYIETDF